MPVSLSCLMRYGVAVLATAATLLFRLSLDAVFEDRVVFLPFTLALLVSAWYGGLGPGLLATGLSASVIALVLLPPRWTPTVALLADGLSLVVFALVGMGMSALVEQLHRARRRAEAEAAERQAADEARREHARFIHQVTELSPVVLDVFDLVTERHRYFNSSSVPLYGYTPDEMTQMEDTFSVLVHPDDMPGLAENMVRLKRLADGEIHEFERRVRRRDGEWRWVAARSMVFARNEQGEVRQTVNATFDVTERKGAEDALRRAQQALEQRVMERTSHLTAANAELLKEIVERTRAEEQLRRSEAYLAEGQRISHTGSWAVQLPTEDVFWSPEVYRIYGLDPATTKLSQQMAFHLIHPDDRPCVQEAFERALREHSEYAVEHRAILPNGSIKHLHALGHPVVNESGTLTEYVGTVMDITERKHAEVLLRQAHERIAMILDSITDQFFAIDQDWRFTYLNPQAAAQMKVLGKEPARLIGSVLWEEFPDVPNEAALRRVMSERVMITDELYYPPLGEWVENHMYPSPDGRIATFQKIARGLQNSPSPYRTQSSMPWPLRHRS